MIRTPSDLWAKPAAARHEYHDVMDRIDVITGTLGKASAERAAATRAGERRSSICCGSVRGRICFRTRLLRRSSAASIAAIDHAYRQSTELRDKLAGEYTLFSRKDRWVGLDVLPGEHPIVPVMFGDAIPAVKMAELLLEKAFMSFRSRSRSCPKERPASERRSLPHIRKKILISRSRNLRRQKRELGIEKRACRRLADASQRNLKLISRASAVQVLSSVDLNCDPRLFSSVPQHQLRPSLTNQQIVPLCRTDTLDVQLGSKRRLEPAQCFSKSMP